MLRRSDSGSALHSTGAEGRETAAPHRDSMVLLLLTRLPPGQALLGVSPAVRGGSAPLACALLVGRP